MIKVLRKNESIKSTFISLDDLKGKIIGIVYAASGKKRYSLSASKNMKVSALNAADDFLCGPLSVYYANNLDEIYVFNTRKDLFKWLCED